ncbi:SapC family protein [Sphingomonas sp. ASV193]|uniref:SapC family protein n=1 Tax=Sphingomonas sp. ASV193 TaxID=3144405 RepID=UPI0032E8D4FC
MSNHAIVDAAAHRELRVRTEPSEAMGDAVMSCFTVPDEFRRLQNEFPILFRRDATSRALSAIVLMGFEAGENLYFDQGQWRARNRPMALAVPPFLVGRGAPDSDQLQLHIDLDHPRVSRDGAGTRLFDDGGRPTALVEETIALLGALDGGHREAGAFYAALDRHQLTESFALDVELASGAKHRMVGYEMIAEERLAALDPAVLGELNAAGQLEPIFMAIASLANLTKLIEWKNARNG